MTDSSNGVPFQMPVMPAYGMGGNGGFGGFGGADGWWVILLLLLCGNGLWGGFGGMGGMMWPMMMGGMGAGFGLDYLYPWLNNSEHISDGFQNQLLNDNITSIRDGVQGISTQLCNGFAGVNQGIANGFAQAEIAANARQMADMQQNFGIQSGISDLKYTVATENFADRAALADGVREIIASNTASTQRILDQLCQDKIDAKNETIQTLRDQLNMANLAASQTAQTAALTADNALQTQYIVNRVAPYPQPAIVYGYNTSWMNGGCNSCGCGA